MLLLPYKLPVPGDSVGAYRVLEHVGRGSQGHVFKAECAGRLFALKFFLARPVAPWGERELDLLRWVEHPHVVRVLGHGRWPDPEQGFLYLVMEWVEGLTLEAHARVHGLSAREAATLVLGVTRALAEAHRRGVLHRDVKPDNILVRRADGKPMLVDFGVGRQEGASTVEGRGQVVGTPEYHSPQAYDFLWEHLGDGTHYRASVADEVWALGVTLYWLLARALPFGSRMTNPDMVRDIRTRAPQAPHERNPRVPVVLGQVCMRLLEKEPRARCADMEEVGAALAAVLAGAEGEAGWDVPLMEPEGAPERPSVPHAPAVPPGAAGPGRAEEAPAAPAVMERSGWRRALSWLVLVPVLLVATVGGLARHDPTPHAGVFREVARSEKPTQIDLGALPYMSPLPASDFATAMLHKQDSRSKPQEKPAPRPQRKAPRCVPLTQEMCVAGICTLLLTGCSATPQVVRPKPKPADCPPGAVKTMEEELEIPIGTRAAIDFPVDIGAKPVTVYESTKVRLMSRLGTLRGGTEFSGRLYLGAERVYGRFIQARTRDGKTYPVCIELIQRSEDTLGVERKDVGGPADSAVVFSTHDVRAVDSFE